ncbi:hypothetical protein TNCV_2411171 [Trichonephila clavipes]|nr:hypothetical protein TNCV_2411171 [Trichonephila clavipes]
MSVVLKTLSRDYLYPSLLHHTTPARRSLAEGSAQNNSTLPAFKTELSLPSTVLFGVKQPSSPKYINPNAATPIRANIPYSFANSSLTLQLVSPVKCTKDFIERNVVAAERANAKSGIIERTHSLICHGRHFQHLL